MLQPQRRPQQKSLICLTIATLINTPHRSAKQQVTGTTQHQLLHYDDSWTQRPSKRPFAAAPIASLLRGAHASNHTGATKHKGAVITTTKQPNSCCEDNRAPKDICGC